MAMARYIVQLGNFQETFAGDEDLALAKAEKVFSSLTPCSHQCQLLEFRNDDLYVVRNFSPENWGVDLAPRQREQLVGENDRIIADLEAGRLARVKDVSVEMPEWWEKKHGLKR